jgi:hypothetical protein
MSGAFSNKSKSAERAYSKFTRSVTRNSKKALVSIQNFEAGARRGFKRFSDKLVNFKNLAIIGTLGIVLSSVVGTFANFEQANVNLASVMGKTVNETIALQDDAKRLGATTAKTATEVVGLQEAFARLGFMESDIINMTESTIAGSVAMQGELSETANLVGAMVRSFDAFESVNAPEIIDQMTLATQKSALNFEKLQTGLPIVAGAANAAGVPFTKLLSLLGKLSDAGIDTSSSATALRNIFIDSAAKGLSYEKILEQIKNSQDKLTTANDKFGKRTSVSAVTLANNIEQIDKLDKTLQKAAGTAGTTAARQLDTLKGSVTILGSAWEGFILSMEDGTGGFSKFLKTTVQVVTEILSLATGTAKATEELDDHGKKIRRIANAAMTLLKIIKLVTIAYIAFKTTMLIVKAATIAYNSAVRIITGVSKAWAAVQWLLNAALWANPITWVVIGILALIAAIAALIIYWEDIVNWVKTSDNVFAKLIRFTLTPLMLLFKGIGAVINWLSEKFSQLVNWVKTSDSGFASFIRGSITHLVNFFKMLGDVIDWLGEKWDAMTNWISTSDSGFAKFLRGTINPIIHAFQQLGEIWDDITGGGSAMDKIKKIAESNLGIETSGKQTVEEIKTDNASDNLIKSLNLNSDELDKNTNASKKEWKGKFSTSILKDANIPNSAIKTAQREIAISGMAREFKNTSIQNSIINNNSQIGPSEVITPFSSSRTNNNDGDQTSGSKTNSNSSQRIDITVHDKTSGNYGLEVESTGLEVNTTGN